MSGDVLAAESVPVFRKAQVFKQVQLEQARCCLVLQEKNMVVPFVRNAECAAVGLLYHWLVGTAVSRPWNMQLAGGLVPVQLWAPVVFLATSQQQSSYHCGCLVRSILLWLALCMAVMDCVKSAGQCQV
jgi:hypothetical protein